MTEATPLQYSHYLSSLTETEFYLKREDLFPEGGGGNKARMIALILKKAKDQNANYIVTAGGPHSNFNRALALMSKKMGFKLRIVLYDNNPHIHQESLNKRICDQTGAEYSFCNSDEVSERIKEEMTKLKNAGEIPFFIYGGGKSYEGIKAYAEVVQEINTQIDPELIATTFATGTTFSGLLAGVQMYLPSTDLLGLSIARTNEISVPIIAQNLLEFFESKTPPVSSFRIKDQILDQYTFGGYGKSNHELRNFIRETMKNTGLILDEIYVGKALFGLTEYLKNNTKYKNKKVVFLLTGGIFNF
ncbi:1-aminocyclopropane-1-carboxylate deaminase/D-cysteine desulfhydrase [Algoriphagus marinus]|uniref:1-aminocyclopropane-1-carboxylate deaminase/D-cysteine desulfhydrase n=1 Tax=Algoriphagus marinus TaxID=1925762 RepID=UPI000A63BA47|nr:pyridoxal-phosphate dependent enzyme [Algoriphagus marinus]